MSYIKFNNKSIVEPLIRNETVLKLPIYKNFYHPPIPPELISSTVHKNLIPYQVLEPGDYTPFVVGSITLTVSSYNSINRTVTFSYVKIEGAGTWEQFDPRIHGMYAMFITGNVNWFMGPGTYMSGGAGYAFTIESRSTFTATYSQSEWSSFVEDVWTPGTPGYYELGEDIVYEKTANYIWGSRYRDGLTLSPYDLQDTEYVRNSYLELLDRYTPSKVFLGKQAFIYLGYGPRNEWGLSGSTLQHIYDIYTCQTGTPPTATYSWAYRGEVEFIGIIHYVWYQTDGNVSGKQLSATQLNSLFPPNQRLQGRYVGDYLRQEYKQVSPGVYQYHYYYDVYECLRIS